MVCLHGYWFPSRVRFRSAGKRSFVPDPCSGVWLGPAAEVTRAHGAWPSKFGMSRIKIKTASRCSQNKVGEWDPGAL